MFAVIPLPRPLRADDESLSGLSILMEIYRLPSMDAAAESVGKVSMLDSVDPSRFGQGLLIARPTKNPPSPFTTSEQTAIAVWTSHQPLKGLVLDGHREIDDASLAKLRPLRDLSLLSLSGTSVTSAGMKEISRLKSLETLDVSSTPVTGAALAALKPLRHLSRVGTQGSAIDAAALEHWKQASGLPLATLSPKWSKAWTTVVKVPVSKEPRAFWFGAAPQAGLYGQLPRGQYPADYNLTLTDMDGNTVRLSEKKGQVIFLNFWESWCPACQLEMASLENVYVSLKDQKNIFFAYVTDEPREVVQNFLAAHPRHLPIYFSNDGQAAPYMKDGIPSTIIISRKSDWALHQRGAGQWDTNEVLMYLLKLINETPSSNPPKRASLSLFSPAVVSLPSFPAVASFPPIPAVVSRGTISTN